MRKPIQVALVAVAVVLAVGAVGLYLQYRQTSADLTESKTAVEQAEARYAQTIDAIVEIQDSLSAISLPDTGVGARPWSVKAGQEPAEPKGQEALERIALVRASIARNKERIRELESNLKKSGVKIAGLTKMIDNLKQTVAEKETIVAQLTARVDTLQTQVVGLETAVQETRDTLRVRELTLEEKRLELATVHYAVGTKKELTKAGVIVEKGGVLGLGQTLIPVPGAPESAFTPLNTDRETVVRMASTKARVLSAQPASSYELRLVDGKMELHILDASEFRKIKRLVILTS